MEEIIKLLSSVGTSLVNLIVNFFKSIINLFKPKNDTANNYRLRKREYEKREKQYRKNQYNRAFAEMSHYELQLIQYLCNNQNPTIPREFVEIYGQRDIDLERTFNHKQTPEKLYQLYTSDMSPVSKYHFEKLRINPIIYKEVQKQFAKYGAKRIEGLPQCGFCTSLEIGHEETDLCELKLGEDTQC